MTQTTEQERAEFEEFASANGERPELVARNQAGEYLRLDTATGWMWWQAARRAQAVPMTLEQAQQSMRSATSHKPGKIIAASGLCAPQPPEEDSLMSEIRTSKTVAAPVQMPEPEALVESKLGTVCMFQSSSMRKGDKIYTEHQVRQLHAAKGVKEKVQVHEPANCWCQACDIATSQYGFRTRMSLCPKCGDKRCPRAQHHGFQCQSEKKD